MTRMNKIGLVIAGMMILATAACGSSMATEPYVVEDVFSMEYPEGWMYEEEAGVVGFTADAESLESMGFVVAYELDLLSESFDIDLSDTEALLNFYYVSSGLGAPDIQRESFGGGDWVISDYDYEDGEYSLQGWIAVGRGNEHTLLVVVGSSPETFADNQASYDMMFESIEFE